MKMSGIKDDLHALLTDGGLDLQDLDADTGVARVLSWYKDERVEDASPLAEDGDMLFFQWGTHDRGRGNWFQYDITRQVSSSGED